jgi:endonuclease I/V8-like Glu-specific endopeptidase
MTTKNNPSLNVDFITSVEQQQKTDKKFGTLGEIKSLAFDPETTAASIHAESMMKRQVADKRDFEILKRDILEAEPETELERAIENDFKEADHEETDELQFERVIDSTDFLPSWFFRVGAERARAVCKIEASGIDYKGRNGYWNGTGFLISPNLLLTNNHVLNSKDVAAKAVCIFNYETDENGKVQNTDTYSINPEKLFITSSAIGGLDFTVCWIDSPAGEKYGYIPVYRHSFGIKNDDCANIIQHPDGRHKAVVVQKNEVQNQTDIAVLYTSDTLAGSSGSSVCNNAWKLVALHHASREIKKADIPNDLKAVYLNEGIKMSAIAAYLEGLSDSDRNYGAARQVLHAFNGVDSAMGYFGSLGRQNESTDGGSDLELVRTSYRGEDKDIDICFWNIEWFNKTYLQKLNDVAWEISIQNLDVWVISESSPQAAEALVTHLNSHYHLKYECAASEPNAPNTKQTTTVLWNTETVEISSIPWPEKVEKWLNLNSSDFKDLEDLQEELEFEAVDGKIFDRYPALFTVKSKTTSNDPNEKLNFYLVPLHLKAMAEGSKRRRFACRILAEAMHFCITEKEFDSEWILGGDLNATLASKDLEELSKGGLTAMSASDAADNAFSYLKKPYRSLIDHIYLSPNLIDRTDKDGFMILARERDTTRDGGPERDYLSISDHRPIMIRLSLVGKTGSNNKKPLQEDEITAKELINLIQSTPLQNNNKLLHRRLPEPPAKQEALKEAANASQRKYYDQEADKTSSEKYYGTIPSGLSGQALFDHFNKLISTTHTTPLSYKPAVYVYPWVDIQEDRNLTHLYNGDRVSPEVLIEADFEIDEQEFESSAMYNCEHVVPQSWFGKKNPQRGDLHHLFACTPNCNSFRGNIPYTEFPDWEEKVMQDCGNREADGFEPKRAKGVVARATLYFMLRYPEVSVPYKGASLQNLLAWNLEEPPGIYEFHRNAAIQELQGNRNPFIDFPKLASKINFR